MNIEELINKSKVEFNKDFMEGILNDYLNCEDDKIGTKDLYLNDKDLEGEIKAFDRAKFTQMLAWTYLVNQEPNLYSEYDDEKRNEKCREKYSEFASIMNKNVFMVITNKGYMGASTNNYSHKFSITIPTNNYLETLKYLVDNLMSEEYEGLEIDALSYRYAKKGYVKNISIHCETKDIDKALKFIGKVNEFIKDKSSTNLGLCAKIADNIGYETKRDKESVSDIIMSCFDETVNLFVEQNSNEKIDGNNAKREFLKDLFSNEPEKKEKFYEAFEIIVSNSGLNLDDVFVLEDVRKEMGEKTPEIEEAQEEVTVSVEPVSIVMDEEEKEETTQIEPGVTVQNIGTSVDLVPEINPDNLLIAPNIFEPTDTPEIEETVSEKTEETEEVEEKTEEPKEEATVEEVPNVLTEDNNEPIESEVEEQPTEVEEPVENSIPLETPNIMPEIQTEEISESEPTVEEEVNEAVPAEEEITVTTEEVTPEEVDPNEVINVESTLPTPVDLSITIPENTDTVEETNENNYPTIDDMANVMGEPTQEEEPIVEAPVVEQPEIAPVEEQNTEVPVEETPVEQSIEAPVEQAAETPELTQEETSSLVNDGLTVEQSVDMSPYMEQYGDILTDANLLNNEVKDAGLTILDYFEQSNILAMFNGETLIKDAAGETIDTKEFISNSLINYLTNVGLIQLTEVENAFGVTVSKKEVVTKKKSLFDKFKK